MMLTYKGGGQTVRSYEVARSRIDRSSRANGLPFRSMACCWWGTKSRRVPCSWNRPGSDVDLVAGSPAGPVVEHVLGLATIDATFDLG